MLFDIASSTKKSYDVELDKSNRSDDAPIEVAAAFWSEHCIECGAPYCYGTCDRYRRGPDLRCRRLEDGIVCMRGENGDYLYAIKFRSWGKIELRYEGLMIATQTAKRLMSLYRVVGRLCVQLNSLLSCLGMLRRRNFITALQHYGQSSFVRMLSKSGKPDKWSFAFMSYSKAELIVEIEDETGIVYHNILHVIPGMVQRQIDIPPNLSGRVLFRIGSLEDVDGPVVFLYNTVGRYIANHGHAKFVKCVVWDLDNTVWDGILADDGIGGVKLRNQVIATIKELDSRGIVNSICSKNDYDNAMEALKKFGISEYFVFPAINWLPKSHNIREIARQMNIGLDSVAFCDDSTNERNEVQSTYPQVRVFADSSAAHLLTLDCFLPPVSEESHLRRFSYMAEMKRHKFSDGFNGSYDDFLKSCDIKLICRFLSESDESSIKRCWELVNRTNQLTLAARRYEIDKFNSLIRLGNCYAIQCVDKFGDYGIVGFISFDIGEMDVRVSEFVMSCRVAKKKCEQSVLVYWAEHFLKSNKRHLIAELIKTARNKALFDAFEELPFDIENTDGRYIYKLNLSDEVIVACKRLFCNKVELCDVSK